ncbi:MAG: UvrB/UvrC motif-containing protein [Kurthia sp.]
MELLRGAMREAIQNENFEEAATIRDTIYELQEQLKQGGVTEE